MPFETAVRFVRGFYEQNKDFATSLARTVGQPVLVEMWEQQSFYFVMKFEFNFNDSVNKAFALSTVQIDTQNPENFGIQYTASDGSRRTPSRRRFGWSTPCRGRRPASSGGGPSARRSADASDRRATSSMGPAGRLPSMRAFLVVGVVLALALRERPDAAIIDVGLPGLDGYEVARRIRAAPDGAAVRS